MSDNRQDTQNGNLSTRQLLKEVSNASVGNFVEGIKQGWSGTKADWGHDNSVVPRDVLADCPACNARISTSAASCPRCGQTLSQELWETTQGARDRKAGRVGAYAILAVLGLIAFGSFTGNSRSDPEALSLGGYACDDAARQRMRNPSSFESAWGKRYRVEGSNIIIWRNYTATNGFGATLDGYYICTYATNQKKVEAIEFRDGNV